MVKPKVDYIDLELAFMSASHDFRHWLDRRTGEILSYDSHIARALEHGDDLSDLPGWQASQVKVAKKILRAFGELPEDEEHPSVDKQAAGEAKDDSEKAADDDEEGEAPREHASGPDRYARIEPIPSDEAFKFMEAFVDTVTNPRARHSLQSALSQSLPFRRFKDVLASFPEQRKRWHDFDNQCTRQYIEQWVREQGLEIDRH